MDYIDGIMEKLTVL